MAKYIYYGPTSGATLQPKNEGDKEQEVMFHDGKPPVGTDGKPADLDPSNEYVARLIARGHLHPATQKTTDKSDTANSAPPKGSK